MADFNVQELRAQILEIVKKEGPVLPSQVSQKVVSNILFTSAILSDLIRQNQIKISKAKIGNSPVYYAKGQEQKLQSLYKHLGETLKKAYDLLKEKRILKDTELESWQRVAMREIKDFAIMLNVNYQSNKEMFWKWYLVPEEEAKQKIIDMLKTEAPIPKKEESKEVKEEVKAEEKPKEVNEEKKEEKPEKIEKEKQEDEQETQTRLKEEKKPERIGEFYGLVNTYFTEKRIRVIEEKILRKNTEYEFLIEVPSSLGNLKYFVKAKNKKKINDAELNMSYTTGEKKKLPTMLISTGDLTKKAEKYLETELHGLIFKKIK